MSNIGKKITDFHCGGKAGRRYDLIGAVIEAEGKDWIMLRLENGEPVCIEFSRYESGEYQGGYSGQELIDEWTELPNQMQQRCKNNLIKKLVKLKPTHYLCYIKIGKT